MTDAYKTAYFKNLLFNSNLLSLDKDRDVEAMTHRIRGQLNDEIENGKQLRADMNSLKTQLEESKAGLLAAARISDQLEICQVTNAALKEERKQKKKRFFLLLLSLHGIF